jgi:hypothetical protein
VRVVAVLVALVVALVGAGLLGQAVRSDRAAKRWTRTRGVVRDATKAHLADDGRRWWNLQVSYREDTGEEQVRWVRQLSDDVDSRRGEGVQVWYDPRRPDRCRVGMTGSSGGASWLEYALGSVLLVGGGAVLTSLLM